MVRHGSLGGASYGKVGSGTPVLARRDELRCGLGWFGSHGLAFYGMARCVWFRLASHGEAGLGPFRYGTARQSW